MEDAAPRWPGRFMNSKAACICGFAVCGLRLRIGFEFARMVVKGMDRDYNYRIYS